MTTQTANSTAKKTAGAAERSDHPVDPEQKIDSLEKRINQLMTKLESARQDEEKLIDQQEKLSEKISSRRSALGEIENEIRSAQAELKTAERDLPAPPVDRTTAEQLAQDLIAAFESARDSDEGQSHDDRASTLWTAIDDARVRLLTGEVSDDAKAIVLAIEAVVSAADDWESIRRSDFAGVKGPDGEPLRDVRHEIFPSESKVVKVMLQELKAVLAGEVPGSIEEVGTLLGQNVAPGQIARMHGLLLADGSPDLVTLGFLIDRALGKTGFYVESNPWRHLKRMGALSATDAWKMRSGALQARREKAVHLPGAAQRAGQRRPGREARVPTEPAGQQALTEEQLHVRRMHAYHRQQQEAANADQAAAGDEVSPAEYSSVLSKQMNRGG